MTIYRSRNLELNVTVVLFYIVIQSNCSYTWSPRYCVFCQAAISIRQGLVCKLCYWIDKLLLHSKPCYLLLGKTLHSADLVLNRDLSSSFYCWLTQSQLLSGFNWHHQISYRCSSYCCFLQFQWNFLVYIMRQSKNIKNFGSKLSTFHHISLCVHKNISSGCF